MDRARAAPPPCGPTRVPDSKQLNSRRTGTDRPEAKPLVPGTSEEGNRGILKDDSFYCRNQTLGSVEQKSTA
ncbi:hypothetical protein SK128_018941 [Halocaridina rubra]|uniref:Uncharacterized protein n=1 Tax=Halocaridina rubra TaxID=373956 RepID=A0AAN8XX55_HALRR